VQRHHAGFGWTAASSSASVDAADEKSAIAAAIDENSITDPERQKRLEAEQNK
jgi:hypothetical protein